MNLKNSVCGLAQKDGLVLVARRNPGGSQGNKWEFPGGKIEYGEIAEDALQREFLEELSVAISVKNKVFETRFRNGPTDYLLEAWLVELKSYNFVLNEHQAYQWLPPTEILDLDLSDSDRAVAQFLAQSLEPLSKLLQRLPSQN